MKMCSSNSTKFWILLFTSIIHLIHGICPDGCICSSRSVVCSCNELSSWNLNEPVRDLHLTGFSSNLNYIELFIVHSCDRVIISNDTFSGVELLEQLKLVDIGQIEIEPYAFRGLRKSPKQFVIQNSNIEILPKHAFTGLTEIDHFWIKNVSIKRIEKHAFSSVANLNYIYFRNVNIEVIDNEAFGNMHHINYFYMRENVTLMHVENCIFQNSHINEIMFENANIKATDFSLLGISAHKVEIISTKWHMIKVSNQKHIPQGIEQFHIKNCTFNRIVPGLFYNYSNVIIDDSEIHHFASLPGYFCKNAVFAISNSKIFQWHSHAFTENTKINSLSVENSQIDRVHSRSMYGAEIESFTIRKSTFLYTVKKFMDQVNVTNFLISQSRFGTLAAETFANSYFKSFLLNENIFQQVKHKAFAAIISQQMQITSCTFTDFPNLLFENSNITDLTILSSHFESAPQKNVFAGLFALELCFTHCDIVCDIQACETNSLFFQKTINQLSWKFEHNRCISPQTLNPINPLLVCMNATEIVTEDGLLCRRRLEVEECICRRSDAPSIIPKTKASILTLGDCENVLLVENHSPHLSAVYLYRIQMINVESLPFTLQTLKVLHSTIRFEKPLLLRNPFFNELEFSGTVIEEIFSKAFVNGLIKTLTLNQSILTNTADNAFENSIIENLQIDSSEIISSGDLFGHVKSANILKSKIKNTYYFSTIPHICLQNNTVDCQCSMEATYSLPNNQCLNATNLCSNENSSSNHNNEYWRKTRNILHKQKLCPNKENLQLLNNASLNFEFCSAFLFVIFRLYVLLF